jgi:GT2 family glycosyltransferase
MARRATFRAVGEFAEGYRFSFEDLEWSWRARQKGIALCFCPEAPAYKLAPQLKGELSPELCLALEASQLRCAAATRGRAYARVFRATRASKSLALWLGATGLNLLFCNASEFLAAQAVVHRAIWKMRPDATPGAELPADAESGVRWETLV